MAAEYSSQGMRVRKNPPISLHSPIDWAANPASDTNWLFQKNALYMVQPFIQAHAKTGEREYLNTALRVVLDWIDFNVLKDRPNPLKWHDMSTGIRATALAYVIDQELRHGAEDTAVTRLLLFAAYEHAVRLADKDDLAKGNHAYLQLVGLAAICHVVPQLVDCDSYLEYANDQMDELISAQFTSEGMHREHSPEYHFYSLARADRILRTGWFQLSAESQRRLDKAKDIKHWLRHPNGDVVMIGDSERRRRRSEFAESIIASEKTPVDEFGKVFPLSGYAILRSPWQLRPAEEHAFLFFWAGEEQPGQGRAHSYAHSHADNFTFEWSDRGIPVIIDSGKGTYERDSWREYFLSTRAHNTVEIDGQNIPNSTLMEERRTHGPEIVSTHSGKGLQHVEAVMVHSEFNVAHRRLLVMKPGSWLTIVDLLESSDVHQYTQWLHLHEDWQVETEDNWLYATHSEGQLSIDSLSPKDVAVQHLRGRETPRIQGWISHAYLRRTPNSAIGYSVSGSSVQYVTLLRWDSDAPVRSSSVETDSGSLKICWKDANSSDGFTFKFGGLYSADINSCP